VESSPEGERERERD